MRTLKAGPNRPDAGGRGRPRRIRNTLTSNFSCIYHIFVDNAHGSPRKDRRWVTYIVRAAAPETPSSGRGA